VQLPQYKGTFDTVEYGTWLCGFFDLYIEDPTPTPIRFFDDIIHLLLGGRLPLKEGLGYNDFGILIIEADGTIRKNDTLRSAQSLDKFKSSLSIIQEDVTNFLDGPEYREYITEQKPTAHECLRCEVLAMCGGGMPTHRFGLDQTFGNPTVYCADQKSLISHMRNKLFISEPLK
jgi:uncharacterized protein